MRKILFTDLDGTLLNDDSVVTGRMYDALEDMSRAGHILVLSSGRPFKSVLNVKNHAGIHFPDTYIIANNGSQIYDCDREQLLYEKTIPLDAVYAAWDLAWGMDVHIHTFQNDVIIALKPNRELEVYTSRVPYEITYCHHPKEVMTKEPYKLLAISLSQHDKLELLQAKIREKLGDRLQTCFSDPKYLEVFHKDAGKGNGLKWLCRYLNIPLDNSFAAGDAENDLSMLLAAGHSIAMKNGDGRLKEVAEMITPKTNDEFGLADVIYDRILQP